MSKFEIQPVQAFKDTMCNATVDSLADIAEISLDSLLEDGIIKDIPAVGFLVRMGQGITSIKNAITAKRILVFVQQVRTNSISDGALQRHIEQLNNSPEKFNEELETILDYIDKQTGYIKAKILGNFYYSFLKKDISWDDLILLADIVDAISITDIDTLLDLYSKREYLKDDNFDLNCAKRLDRCSLIDYFNGMIVSSKKDPRKQMMARINNIGDAFVMIGLKNISNFSFSLNIESEVD